MFRVKRHETSEIFTAQVKADPYILMCVLMLGKYPLSYSATYGDRSREGAPRGILHGIPRDISRRLRKPLAEECEKHKDASKRH
jgi:hypothetical protein